MRQRDSWRCQCSVVEFTAFTVILLFLPVLNLLLSLELFVYLLHLIIGILSLCTSAYPTILLLLNPVLNLTFSLLSITSSHSYASTSDSTCDYWRCIDIWLTLTRTHLDLFGPDIVERQVGSRYSWISDLGSVSSLRSTSPRLEHAAVV